MAEGSVSLTGTEVKVYTGSVLHDYKLADLFGSQSMIHFGMYDAEVLNQPIVIHGEASYIDDDVNHTNQDSEFVAADIPLYTPLKASNRVKKRSVQERPGLRHLQNLGESHGKTVGNTKTTSILSFLADITGTTGNEVQGDFDNADQQVVGQAVQDSINTIATNMDQAEVDADGRYIFMKSSAFYALAAMDAVISTDFGGQANRQTIGGNMATINYLNFTVVNCGIGFGVDYSNAGNYPTRAGEAGLATNLTGYYGIAWQKKAWAIREQVMPQTSIDWVARLQVWQTLTRYQFGLQGMWDGTSKGPANGGIWAMTNAGP